MMKKKENDVRLSLLQWLLSDGEKREKFPLTPEQCADADWEQLYSFFSSHTIAPLASDLIRFIPEKDAALRKKWTESVYSNVYIYSRLVKRQKQLLETFGEKGVPVAVLKGTSAAGYYPKPQLRTMGDIDLLVRPEDFERAAECLAGMGCNEHTSQSGIREGRHSAFRFRNVEIELHHYYSSYMEFSTPGEYAARMEDERALYLDRLLFDAIPENKGVLPDEENGLVLLFHIRHHLENGLGLRQIIDWMMFVRSRLDDEMWFSSFRDKAQRSGLETLAVTVTGMCRKYLGLEKEGTVWCECADDEVCDALMDYILDCGNFGRNREYHLSGVASRIPSPLHPIRFLKYAQSHGEFTWKALKKHPWLKPFAWLYQSLKYVRKAVKRKLSAEKLADMYSEGRKRNELFAALGMK